MDLAGGLDQILEVGAREEVAEVDEFAMVLVFDVYHAPTVLAATDLLTTNDDGFLASNNCEGNDVLQGCLLDWEFIQTR